MAVTLQVAASAGNVSKTVSLSGGALIDVSEAVAADVIDSEMTIAIEFTGMQAIYILCDTGIKIETNNATSPTDTITLLANNPLLWYVGSGLTNPITADVTKMFITENDSKSGTLILKALYDVTP